jgi:hypothetical protein
MAYKLNLFFRKMKIVLLLAFVQIALSAFCINGQYNFQYSVYGNNYNYTIRSFSNVDTPVDEELVIKNIKDIQIGDYVRGFNDYFTVVTEKYETRIANPQMYFHNRINLSDGNYEVQYGINYNVGGNYAAKTFTDEKPYIFNSTYAYEDNNYQFGIQQYNVMNDPLVTHDIGYNNCSYIDYYPRGTNIANMAAITKVMNNVSLLNCYYEKPTIAISECDAIGIKTESGYITVNGIFFKLN